MIRELKNHIRNDMDELMYDQLIIETAPVVDTRIGDMICTCTSNFRLTAEKKSVIQDTLTGLNADSFGCVAVMLNMIPYFELKFHDVEKVSEISNSYVGHLMLYLLKGIRKGEFVERIWQLQETVGISYPFYNALIDYFGARRAAIVKPVLVRI